MKNRIFPDATLVVVGVFVILLIASSALGMRWFVRLGPLVGVWPNRMRHGLFVALAMVVGARLLLWRTRCVASGSPESPLTSSLPVNGWLLGVIAGLLTSAVSWRAFGVLNPSNIPYHEWAHWVLERPLERLALIMVPGPDWGSGGHNIWPQGYFRPVPSLTYLVDLIWGATPGGVLLFNIVLYSVLPPLVGLLGWRLTRDSRVVWASALMFALFPLHAEVVLEAEHRADTLYSLFYLSALVWFMDFERSHDRTKFAWSLGAFLLAILSKEQGLSFPVLLGFYLTVSSFGSWWARLKRVSVIITPYMAIAVLVILYRVAIQGKIGGMEHHGALWLDRRLLTLGSLVFSGLVYPLPLSVMPASTLRLLAVTLLSTPLLCLLRAQSFNWRLGFLLGALPISASVSSTIIELTETGGTVWYFTLPSAFLSIIVALSVLVLPTEKVRQVSLPLVALYVAVYAMTFYLLEARALTAYIPH